MAVDFYQLGQSPVERVLPRLAERILGEGGRMLVVSESEAQLASLDDLLWRYTPESFVPHGRTGTADAPDQPLLLSDDMDPLNGAAVVALVDGRWRDEALSFARALHFFDESGMEEARAAWRAVSARGVPRTYWRQVGGRWEKAASGDGSGAAPG